MWRCLLTGLINFAAVTKPTVINSGLPALKSFLQKNQERVILIADKHTLRDCYPLLDIELPHFIVPYGEGYKNLQSCEYVWKKLTDLGANRKTIIVCLGGGVLCDLVAFSASSFLRGVDFVLCPTTLLAMVDAAIGGKNGVNFLGFKNYIGSFTKASEIFICEDFLNSLEYKHFIQGYVEMIKHGLIADKGHYDKVKLLFLKSNAKLDSQLIHDSIAIKLKHVEEDFTDNGIRKRLNFGHTIGHAIESYSLADSEENKEWSHGECVAMGLIAECYLSHKKAGLSLDELNEIVIVLQGIVKALDKDIPSCEEIWPFMLKDKKNNAEGVNFSLLSSIGNSKEDYILEPNLIEESIDYLRSVR